MGSRREDGNGEGARAAVRPSAEGTILLIEVQPGSARPGRMAFDRWRGRIRVAVGEKAEKGKANAEVLALVSDALGVPGSAVRIASGPTDRRKTVAVAGISPDEALERLRPRLEGE